MTNQKQWRFWKNSSAHAKRLMDNFAVLMHLFNHWHIYQHMNRSYKPITPFMSTDESTGDTVSIWTLFSHTGIYIMAIGLLIPAGLGIFYYYFFQCQPARLVHQSL